MTDRAILIVDDEPIILLSLRQQLRRELGSSYRYEIAHDAEAGLAVFDEFDKAGIKIILLVSDWLMPGMKGDEFLMKVRESHPGVRTIMISGQTDEGDLKKLLDSGALDSFMRKPWVSAQLFAECRRLLSA